MSFDLLHPRLEFASRSDDFSHPNKSLVITEEGEYHPSPLQGRHRADVEGPVVAEGFFQKPTTLDTANFGGMLMHMWT